MALLSTKEGLRAYAPLSISPDMSLTTACEVMAKHHLAALAVVDANGPCGLLREGGAIRHMDAHGAPSEQVPVSALLDRHV